MKILKELRNKFDLTIPQLVKELNFTEDAIKKYEMNLYNPTKQNLISISTFFNFSLDYLVNEGKTDYPKNLTLLNLSKEIDDKGRNERFQIESTAASLLNKYEDKEFNCFIDNVNINLTGSFHENLKILRKNKKLTQEEVGKEYGITKRMISIYENNSFPPYDKLIIIAKRLDVSVHALVTGEMLFFDYKDKHFGDTMLKADHFLSIDHHKFLIELMEVALKP